MQTSKALSGRPDKSAEYLLDLAYSTIVMSMLGNGNMQLEEFERAVRSSYGKSSSDDSRSRHRDFIDAIQENISKIEQSLQESTVSDGKASLPWVRLNEGERNELALFLSGIQEGEGKSLTKSNGRDSENQQLGDKNSSHISKNLLLSSEWGSLEPKEDNSLGHRRTASASADISSWKIAVADDVQPYSSSNGPVHKVPSFSGFISSMESVSKMKWPKNAFRKLKAMDNHHGADSALLPSVELNRVRFIVCYTSLFMSFFSCIC